MSPDRHLVPRQAAAPHCTWPEPAPETGQHRQGPGVSIEVRATPTPQSPLSAAGCCAHLGPGHLERTGMTRISGPRQVRIKPLVPRSIPPCSGDKLPMLPQRPRHTQARAASSDWRRRFRRQLTEGRKHRKKEVRCRTRRNRPNLLEVLHRAAASCAEQSAGRGKCCVQGGLPELGGKPPHLPNRDDRGRAPIQKIPFVMQTIY